MRSSLSKAEPEVKPFSLTRIMKQDLAFAMACSVFFANNKFPWIGQRRKLYLSFITISPFKHVYKKLITLNQTFHQVLSVRSVRSQANATADALLLTEVQLSYVWKYWKSAIYSLSSHHIFYRLFSNR